MSEENNMNEDVVSYNFGGDVDISLPDIPLPTVQEKKDVKKDECEVAFKFAFIGAGQGGSRIAESFYNLGYRKLSAINTAQQDLNTIKLENKLCIGDGGAGKDPSKAEKLFNERKEDVLDFMRDSFGDDIDRVFVCAGAGGGSGAGMCEPLIHAAKELQEIVNATNKKVGCILALPKHSEGKKVNENAHNTLNKVLDLVEQGVVSPLIILDNEKVHQLYPGLAVAPFWRTANSSTAGLFHLFNLTASKDSTYSSFDSNDYKQLLDSGLIVFGASPVPNWENASDITKTVRDNLRNNILSGGIDLSTGNSAGVVMIGGKEVLDNVPQENLDRAFDQFTRILGPHSVVHRGIYSGDKPTLTVYTLIGGLGRPEEKVNQLKQLGELQ
jgi:cell division GTPase FtsZ